jgi:hypothetical protein
VSRLRKVVLVAVAVVLLVLAFVLPVIPYSVSFGAPYNYNQHIAGQCEATFQANKNFSELQACLRGAALPPATVTGYASAVYGLFGLSTGPFPSVMIAKQGNVSFLLHFQGARISYIDMIPIDSSLPPDLNPSGVVRVDNVSIGQWAFARLNFSARVTNIGAKRLWNVGVSFNYPTYGTNGSFGSVRTYLPEGATCAAYLDPGASCTGSLTLNQSSRLLTNQYYPMILEVSGSYSLTVPSQSFIYVDTTSVPYPGVGLNSHWVQAFIQAIVQRRNGSTLTENKTLDEFAAFRFTTLRAKFQISDYNFTTDYNRFFTTSKPAILEEILYPEGKDPVLYPDYLKSTAITHYSDLLNTAYSHYGYFFGTGPAVEVGPGCTATEVPGPGIDLIQWATSHGCSYVIADEVWFILILGG